MNRKFLEVLKTCSNEGRVWTKTATKKSTDRISHEEFNKDDGEWSKLKRLPEALYYI